MFGGVALMVLYFVARVAAPAATTMDLRKAAPNFALTDSKGGAIKLSEYRGKVILLDFWATWCGGCKVEIPWYMEFQDKYRDRGLAVVGVSMDEDGWKVVKPFLEKNKINYPVVIGNDHLAKLYGLESMPMTLLIDRGGKIATSHVGMVKKDAFEKEIQILLKERGGNTGK